MRRVILSKKDPSDALNHMILHLLKLGSYEWLHDEKTLDPKEPTQVILACDLNPFGEDPFISQVIASWLSGDPLDQWEAGVLVNTSIEYGTKRYAQRVMFYLNNKGVRFRGHSFVERIDQDANFKTWQKQYQVSLKEVCEARVEEFHQRLHDTHVHNRQKIVVLHASQQETSNTLMLWQTVEKYLVGMTVEILHIENGQIVDCKGCDFKTCAHYAKNHSCFYGGQVTNQILPAIEEADMLVWVCPNYNDAISAMHTALINRLTVLYRRIPFHHKQVYGIVVSGNSGSDSVACQLIGGLCINKGFNLPPYAMLTAIANDPGTIIAVEGIEEKAKQFAKRIMAYKNQ